MDKKLRDEQIVVLHCFLRLFVHCGSIKGIVQVQIDKALLYWSRSSLSFNILDLCGCVGV